jgi:hypothetical protein
MCRATELLASTRSRDVSRVSGTHNHLIGDASDIQLTVRLTDGTPAT